jgi:hypothetical protein
VTAFSVGVPALARCGAAATSLAGLVLASALPQLSLMQIDITKTPVGVPPAEFEFAITGEGEVGRWAVVRDPTAVGEAAIEHRSDDPHENRFPLAIFQPISAENVDFSARVKIISGTLLAAGIAVGVRSPNSYYAIVLSALEHRVDVLLVLNGKTKRLESAEAEIARDRWHELRVVVNDDHFTVKLDGAKLLTTYDRSRRKDGRIALWTQEDNVTRFDRIVIQALPDTEYR